MKRKRILSMLFFAATAMALNAAPIGAQSVGGTRSERSGGDSDTPVPPQGQPGDAGKATSGTKAPSGAAQRNTDTSVGGTQSERAGDSDTPLPPQGTPGDASKNRNRAATGSKGSSGTAQGNKDTSVGGTQSERSGGDSQTPLPKGSRSAGADSSSGLQSRTSGSESRNMNGQQEVRLVQEALKNQGHDPGPIDGVMGSQTRQALREFQSANGLRQTGRLDAQTKQKLNIEGSSSTAPIGR